MIANFNDLFAELKARNICKKLVVAWGVDEHSIEAAYKAAEAGFVEATLVGDAAMIKEVCAANGMDVAKFNVVDNPVELKAVAQAVQMVHDGEGDVLMKGLCSTDKFLRAILNKETGLLPPKGLLSHVGVIENPNYPKLMFVTDMAVIPAPDFRQKVKETNYMLNVAHSFGIAKPKVAFISATEQMLDSIPSAIEGAMLAKMCDRGQIKGCIGEEDGQEQGAGNTHGFYNPYDDTNYKCRVYSASLVKEILTNPENGAGATLDKDLIETRGNADYGNYTPTAIKGVADNGEAQVMGIRYYNLNGALLDAPQKGVNIIEFQMSNGTKVVNKINK